MISLGKKFNYNFNYKSQSNCSKVLVWSPLIIPWSNRLVRNNFSSQIHSKLIDILLPKFKSHISELYNFITAWSIQIFHYLFFNINILNGIILIPLLSSFKLIFGHHLIQIFLQCQCGLPFHLIRGFLIGIIG